MVRAKEHDKEYFEILTEVIKKHVHMIENTKIQKCEKKAVLKEKIIWKLRKIKHKNVLKKILISDLKSRVDAVEESTSGLDDISEGLSQKAVQSD